MKVYDLKDRTYRFAKEIVKFCLILLKNSDLREIGRQLIKSGTSIGANVEEADGSPTRKDFANKMTISRNEAKETRFWLRIIIDTEVIHNKENLLKAKDLLAECEELIKILSSIIKKIKMTS
jgi:four helix bundle protein